MNPVVSRRGTPQPFTLGTQFSLDEPLDFEDGRHAARRLAELRGEAIQMLESAYAELAELEGIYRRARRQARAQAPRVVRGEVTAGDRDDWVDAETSDEREARDRAKFKVEIVKERLEEIDGTRASFHRLLEWSMRVDPDAMAAREPVMTQEQAIDAMRKAQQGR